MEDIRKDEFGVWNYSGSHPKAYKVNEDMSRMSVQVQCNIAEMSSLHSPFKSHF